MKEIVILADGEFPEHKLPLGLLRESKCVVCCDGAAASLDKAGMTPFAIVGDLDSLDDKLRQKYAHILIFDSCQETNDLTKAFRYSLSFDPKSITILGATGKREDHTLGNISLLCDYAAETKSELTMCTNHGIFRVIQKSGIYDSCAGMQVSFFSMEVEQRVRSKGLKYPLDDVIFDKWWKATLNECKGDHFELELSLDAPLIMYSSHK
ncbi:MAG: thiamine diphosphokinase [Rikenellaceae bacterium]|nr:thiamine diphosphokinase [Rikenellaceae bacterium]